MSGRHGYRRNAPLEERVTMLPDAPGCWLWLGAMVAGNRPQMRVRGRGVLASHVYYERFVGTIPNGFSVLHKCDTGECLRPDHLFLGTQADNVRDALQKGRIAHGVRMPQAKLNPESVKSIRSRVAGGESMGSLAEEYGVDRSAISYAARRVTWKRVE